MIGVVAPRAFGLMQKATIVATMIGGTVSIASTIASTISWVSTIAPIAITACCIGIVKWKAITWCDSTELRNIEWEPYRMGSLRGLVPMHHGPGVDHEQQLCARQLEHGLQSRKYTNDHSVGYHSIPKEFDQQTLAKNALKFVQKIPYGACNNGAGANGPWNGACATTGAIGAWMPPNPG